MLILAAIASMLLSGGNASAATAAVEPAFAPAEYAYPEYFTEIDLTDGFRWTINDQGQFVLTDKNDDQYVILPDGSVYQIGDDPDHPDSDALFMGRRYLLLCDYIICLIIDDDGISKRTADIDTYTDLSAHYILHLKKPAP